MKRYVLLLALAASTVAMASMQAVDPKPTLETSDAARDLRTCKALVQKMEVSPSANTWRNRVRTWQCRDDLSPDTPETVALLRGLNR